MYTIFGYGPVLTRKPPHQNALSLLAYLLRSKAAASVQTFALAKPGIMTQQCLINGGF